MPSLRNKIRPGTAATPPMLGRSVRLNLLRMSAAEGGTAEGRKSEASHGLAVHGSFVWRRY
jgi:hypothetical protein